MTGRARESIFSILGSRVSGARVLDLYAGTGSLGLEAMSRGATDVMFVESGRQAARCLERNTDRVGLGGYVVQRSVGAFLAAENAEFDVIFVDPPYADDDREVRDVLEQIEGVLSSDGIVVLHRQVRSSIELPEFLHRVDERRYGDAVITMMERAPE
jgi:16S rRNA (guanine966-N2)-methyltransferase